MPNLFKMKNGRSPYWHCWYRHPKTGEQRYFSCKTEDKRQAEEYALRRLHKIRYGEEKADDGVRRSEGKASISKRLSELCEIYLDLMSQTFTKKTQNTIRDSFRQMQKRIGDKMVHEITLDDCQRFILKYEQPGGTQSTRQQVHTVRKHYQHLRSAFTWAVEAGFLTENHFIKFKRPKAPESELDYFSEDDFDTLYMSMPTATYAERRLRNLVVLAYETGMRLAELRFLQLDSVDLKNRRVKIRVTEFFVPKNKKGRVVPLSDNALDAIQAQLADIEAYGSDAMKQSMFLFPTETGKYLSESTVEHAFARLRKRCFPDRKLGLHSLRHGFVTRLVLQGVSDQFICKITGHHSVRVMERYAHLRDKAFGPTLRALNQGKRYGDRQRVSTEDEIALPGIVRQSL